MILFYTHIPDTEQNIILPEIESAHCVRVLRKKAGDIIDLTDGKGCFYKARIEEDHPKRCQVAIIETIKEEKSWPCFIEIALAPTKNIDRVEWFVEKAVEIGIDRITFLKTEHSERKDIKTERIEKIMVSAMKQSQKARLPELRGMTKFKDFVTGTSFTGQRFMAHCYPEEKVLLSQAYHKGKDALVLIGPEGDFSQEEVKLALDNQFIPVSLGESRLRTETAALIACHTMHVLNEL